MNPFVILGVPHDVDDATLKKAYFKKLREHPPESDPEKFQAVQDAFEALRDPVRRRALAEPELPALAVDLMERASAASGPEALKLIQRLLTELPHLMSVQLYAVRGLARLGHAPLAVGGARKLTASHPRDVEPWLLLGELEPDAAVARVALAQARELAPHDRRPLYFDALRTLEQRRAAEALVTLDAAAALSDRRHISDGELAAARIHASIEQGAALTDALDRATAEAVPSLVMLAALMISTGRTRLAATLLDKVYALQPLRPRLPLGPARVIPLDRLPPDTRAHVEANAHSPSSQTVHIRTVAAAKPKGWVLKPAWWVELRRLHLIVRRANGVQALPLLSLKLQQREADVPVLLCDDQSAGLEGMPELAVLFEAAMSRKSRLLQLMARDFIEAEQQLEPLTWTLSSNA